MIHVLILSPVPAMRAGLRALISDEAEFTVDAGWELAGEGELAGLRVAIITADVLETIDLTNGIGSTASTIPFATNTMSTAVNIPPDAPVLLVQDVDDSKAETPLPAALTVRPSWGVISSEASGAALRAAVRALAHGLVVLPPERALDMLALNQYEGSGAIMPGGAKPPLAGQPIFGPEDEPVEALTPREGDVLRLLAQGLTNRQIAAALGISEHTVKFHVSAIYAKLRVSNRAEAVRTGARWGFVAL